MSKLEPHEIALRYPWSEEACASMVKDIEANGQREEIVLLNGKILDGRHRYEACIRLSIEPRTREFGSRESDGTAPTRFAHSMNVERRHVNKSVLAALAAESVDEAQRAAAKARQSNAGGDRRKKAVGPLVDQPLDGTKPTRTDALSLVADEFGVHRSQAYRAQTLKREAPEVFERVKAGELTVYAAEREAGVGLGKPKDPGAKSERDGSEAPSKLRRGQHPPNSPLSLAAREREEKVRELRAQGLTQREVGKAIGLEQTSVSTIEKRIGLRDESPKKNPLEKVTEAVVSLSEQAAFWRSHFRKEWGAATPEEVDEFKRARGALDSALQKFTTELERATKERD